MIKTKSGVKLWFSFHPNSLKPVGKPSKGRTPFPVPGQGGSRDDSRRSFHLRPCAPVCLLSFRFYPKERETVTNPGSNRTDKVCPRERPLSSLHQALNSSKVTARVAGAQSESSGRQQTPQQTLCLRAAHLTPWGPPVPFHS